MPLPAEYDKKTPFLPLKTVFFLFLQIAVKKFFLILNFFIRFTAIRKKKMHKVSGIYYDILSRKRSQLKSDEIPLVMLADRADLRC